MKLKRLKLAPLLIASGVIAAVCLLRLAGFDFLERLERITYDLRVRAALHFPQPAATNLGFVSISDQSIAALNRGLLGRSYGLYWPRHVYGRLVRELAAQNATAVGFDIVFGELRPDHGGIQVPISRWPDVTNFLAALHPGEAATTIKDGDEEFAVIDSDDYFAWQLKRSGISILAMADIPPISLLATNSLAIGHILADADSDGVLRRARAYQDFRVWDPILVIATAGTAIDLDKARVESGEIRFFTSLNQPIRDDSGKQLSLKLNASGEFDVREHINEAWPAGESPWRRPFTFQRAWHMGIQLAARELNLDLISPRVELEQGRIIFQGTNGVQRVLPVDREGFFPINWEIGTDDTRLSRQPIEHLLLLDNARSNGQPVPATNRWQDKLIVVGSIATGNDLTDRGATPLGKHEFLVGKHWNVANSLITGRFVRRTSLGTELFIFVLLGALTAWLTWQLRVVWAATGVVALAIGYASLAMWFYLEHRYWLPVFLPIGAVMLLEHVILVTYRVLFEQAERRRVKSFFSQVVSPDIVNVLLGQEKLSLVGERREVTVFFADVRGFTELTDLNQEKAEAFVKEHKLSEAAANVYYDEEARETLNTINFYLALVADMVKKHNGTLDKYIGDCVMAFWGAPTPNAKHALACVQAAIEAQRAIHEVNQRRKAERENLELENRARVSAGLTPKPLLPTLSLGTGINTGQVTVGLMGSEAHIRNYTVFGREVNLASRLEGVSGHGRIIIGETTFQHLRRDAPELAARCKELEATKPKGFKNPVKNYEVPWSSPDVPKESAEKTLETPLASS